jgi:hypothetical protein
MNNKQRIFNKHQQQANIKKHNFVQSNNLILERAEIEMKNVLLEEYEKRKAEYQKIAIGAITITHALVLKDKFNWTKEDINKLIEHSIEQFLLIQDKYLSLDDIEKWAIEEGIRI